MAVSIEAGRCGKLNKSDVNTDDNFQALIFKHDDTPHPGLLPIGEKGARVMDNDQFLIPNLKLWNCWISG